MENQTQIKRGIQMLISVCALSLGKRTDEFLMNKNVTWLNIAQTQHRD